MKVKQLTQPDQRGAVQKYILTAYGSEHLVVCPVGPRELQLYIDRLSTRLDDNKYSMSLAYFARECSNIITCGAGCPQDIAGATMLLMAATGGYRLTELVKEREGGQTLTLRDIAIR